MKTRILFAIATFAAAFLNFTDLDGRSRNRQVLIIGLDGISVDGLAEAETPNLDRIFAEGSSTVTMRNVMPTITMPNWTSLLSGSGPEQHGVLDNRWSPDNVLLPAVVKDQEGYYPSIFKVVKDSDPEFVTGFYFDWKQLINPFNPNYLDHVFLADPDDYNTIYDAGEQFIRDNSRKDFFFFLYAGFTDNVGHRFGWMTPEYIDAIEAADIRIGQLFQVMEQEGIYEDCYILFITDHGGLDRHHGGNSPQEVIVPWALKGPGIKAGHVLEGTSNTIDTAPIILDILGLDAPESWIGRRHNDIFKKGRSGRR